MAFWSHGKVLNPNFFRKKGPDRRRDMPCHFLRKSTKSQCPLWNSIKYSPILKWLNFGTVILGTKRRCCVVVGHFNFVVVQNYCPRTVKILRVPTKTYLLAIHNIKVYRTPKLDDGFGWVQLKNCVIILGE